MSPVFLKLLFLTLLNSAHIGTYHVLGIMPVSIWECNDELEVDLCPAFLLNT